LFEFWTRVALDDAGSCPLLRVDLPRAERWSEAPRPGGFRHITIEEACAMIWSLESRLDRPSEVSCKCVRGGDNVANVAVFLKGRSPSKQFNHMCRRACAIQLGGHLIACLFWVASATNPSDKTSRLFSAEKSFSKIELPAAKIRMLQMPHDWSVRPRLFVRLCSGVRRQADLCWWIDALAADAGLVVCTVAWDPSNGAGYDLTSVLNYDTRVKLCDDGHVLGCQGSPPCSTFSAARHVPLPEGRGPRPLCSRFPALGAVARSVSR
jgi:hypothetical protein